MRRTLLAALAGTVVIAGLAAALTSTSVAAPGDTAAPVGGALAGAPTAGNVSGSAQGNQLALANASASAAATGSLTFCDSLYAAMNVAAKATQHVEDPADWSAAGDAFKAIATAAGAPAAAAQPATTAADYYYQLSGLVATGDNAAIKAYVEDPVRTKALDDAQGELVKLTAATCSATTQPSATSATTTPANTTTPVNTKTPVNTTSAPPTTTFCDALDDALAAHERASGDVLDVALWTAAGDAYKAISAARDAPAAAAQPAAAAADYFYGMAPIIATRDVVKITAAVTDPNRRGIISNAMAQLKTIAETACPAATTPSATSATPSTTASASTTTPPTTTRASSTTPPTASSASSTTTPTTPPASSTGPKKASVAVSPAKPTLTLVSGRVQAPVTMTATGTGFQPKERVTGVMNSDPLPLEPAQTADAQGKVTFTWQLPATTAAGQHTVVLTGDVTGPVTSDPFTVTRVDTTAPPTPSPTPTSTAGPSGTITVAQSGMTLTVKATGYAPGDSVKATIAKVNGSTSSPLASLTAAVANAAGTVAFTWTIPSGTATGTYSVTLTGPGAHSQSKQFTLTAAKDGGVTLAGTGPGPETNVVGVLGLLALALGASFALAPNLRHRRRTHVS